MQYLKILLVAVLGLTITGAGLVVASNRGFWEPPTLVANAMTGFTQAQQLWQKTVQTLPVVRDQFAKIPETAEPQLQVLGERTQVVQGEVNKVVSSKIKNSDDPTPLHERALEQAQYLYCQEVVRKYEAQIK